MRLSELCNHNCFACPFEDCISDDAPTALEEAESEQRDYDAWRYNCPADYSDEATALRKAECDRKRRYRQENPDKCRAYQKQYRADHLEERRAKNNEWYWKNRERIRAMRAEKYQRKVAKKKDE